MKDCLFKRGMVFGIIFLLIWSTIVPVMEASDSQIASGDLGKSFRASKLARTSDNVLHCVYTRLDSMHYQIYYSYSIDDGETWNEVALTAESYNQTDPGIATDSNDYLHVVWQGCHSGSPDHPQIRYIKYASIWGEIDNITEDIGWDQRTPAIAIDGNDNLHVVWQKSDYLPPNSYGPIYYS